MRITFLVSLCVAVSCLSGIAHSQERQLPVTYRDFRGVDTTHSISDPPNVHPDFENRDAYCWNVKNQAPVFVIIFGFTVPVCGLDIGPQIDPGIVAVGLGLDGKPVFNGPTPTTTNATNFDLWFNDDVGFNTRIDDSLSLVDSGGGLFVFDSSSFFPLDNRGFGATQQAFTNLWECDPDYLCLPGQSNVPVDPAPHNWHFTMELHTQFTFQGGEVFNYEGDDDLWVFIDGSLVIDIGGVHNPLPDSVALDTLTDTGGTPIPLIVGNDYDFDLFFAERHHNESNFLMTTSILLGSERCEGNVVLPDDVVNVDDLLELLGDWGDCPLPCTVGLVNAPDTCPADTDRNCVVDVEDLLTLLAAWGACP